MTSGKKPQNCTNEFGIWCIWIFAFYPAFSIASPHVAIFCTPDLHGSPMALQWDFQRMDNATIISTAFTCHWQPAWSFDNKRAAVRLQQLLVLGQLHTPAAETIRATHSANEGLPAAILSTSYHPDSKYKLSVLWNLNCSCQKMGSAKKSSKVTKSKLRAGWKT